MGAVGEARKLQTCRYRVSSVRSQALNRFSSSDPIIFLLWGFGYLFFTFFTLQAVHRRRSSGEGLRPRVESDRDGHLNERPGEIL